MVTSRRARDYWNACVFLAIVNDEQGRVDHCVNLFREASIDRKTQIYTSAVTLSECANVAGTPEREEMIRQFFTNPCLTIVNVDRLIGERSRALRRTIFQQLGRKLAVRDSIHLATPLDPRVRAAKLLTYDGDDLIRISGMFDIEPGGKLTIAEPRWEGNLQLL